MLDFLKISSAFLIGVLPALQHWRTVQAAPAESNTRLIVHTQPVASNSNLPDWLTRDPDGYPSSPHENLPFPISPVHRPAECSEALDHPRVCLPCVCNNDRVVDCAPNWSKGFQKFLSENGIHIGKADELDHWCVKNAGCKCEGNDGEFFGHYIALSGSEGRSSAERKQPSEGHRSPGLQQPSGQDQSPGRHLHPSQPQSYGQHSPPSHPQTPGQHPPVTDAGGQRPSGKRGSTEHQQSPAKQFHAQSPGHQADSLEHQHHTVRPQSPNRKQGSEQKAAHQPPAEVNEEQRKLEEETHQAYVLRVEETPTGKLIYYNARCSPRADLYHGCSTTCQCRLSTRDIHDNMMKCNPDHSTAIMNANDMKQAKERCTSTAPKDSGGCTCPPIEKTVIKCGEGLNPGHEDYGDAERNVKACSNCKCIHGKGHTHSKGLEQCLKAENKDSPLWGLIGHIPEAQRRKGLGKADKFCLGYCKCGWKVAGKPAYDSPGSGDHVAGSSSSAHAA